MQMNNIRRTIAGVGALAVMATSFASCGAIDNGKEKKEKKLSLSEMIETGNSLLGPAGVGGTGEININVCSDDEEVDVDLQFSTGGKLMSIDKLNISTPDGKVKVGNVLMANTSDLYINVDEVISVLDYFAELDGESLDFDASDFDIEWLEIPVGAHYYGFIDDTVKMDDSDYTPEENKLYTIGKDILTEIIDGTAKKSETDNGYEITLEGVDNIKSAIGIIADNLDDNKSDIADELSSMVDVIGSKDVYTEEITDLTVECIEAFCDTLDINYSDDDIDDLMELLSEEGDYQDIVDIDIDEIKKELHDRIVEFIDDTVEDIEKELDEDMDNIEDAILSYHVELTGDEGERVYSTGFEFRVTGEDEDGEAHESSVTVEYTFTECKGSVSLPDAKTIPEAIPGIINGLRELDEDIDESLAQFKGMELSDVIEAMFYTFDYGYDWDDDDYDWDYDWEDYDWDYDYDWDADDYDLDFDMNDDKVDQSDIDDFINHINLNPSTD